MMKKLLIGLLTGAMVLGCVACGGNDTAKVEVADAQELLTKVWDTYAEEEKFFAMGGHFEAPVDNGPGTYDVAKAEDLEMSFCIPADKVAMVDDAATIMHAMNANNFSAAAYHVTDAANVTAIIDAIKERTMNNQWMCGFPEELIIVTVGENYIVSAFGSADIVDNFQSKLAEVYGDAAVVSVEQNLME
ncbi:MAG: hypothetical protein IJD24_00625 [Agathobacter sp.]|nr:hypothetical protein [Agathobacter sp.]MBQ6811643.1 hypothetical protein [Agathobacter sp.]